MHAGKLTVGMSGKPLLITRIWRFYRDGFREMTTGKSLWVLKIVKLVLIFVVMKLLFLPALLKRDYKDDDSRADAVRSSLLDKRR